ncbi:MAG: transglycosylase SLT domain-containing protein [Pseudomonadota bacterium]
MAGPGDLLRAGYPGQLFQTKAVTGEASLGLKGARGAADGVTNALQAGAKATGVDFKYLFDVASRESSLNPTAKARTSSATGLFQFIEQTWLSAVKNYGEKHGLAEQASAIQRSGSGRYVISDPAKKAEVLELRNDPETATRMAAELTLENKRILEVKLGRKVSGAELYAAHFLGPSGASKLLQAGSGERADQLAPQAAKANRSVFFDGARPKSVGELIASFESSIGASLGQLAQGKTTGPSGLQTKGVMAPAALGNLRSASLGSSKPTLRINPETDNISSITAGQKPSSDVSNKVAKVMSAFGGNPEIDPVALMVLQTIDPTIIDRSGEKKSPLF